MIKRKPAYYGITRRQKRYIAKENMKKEGKKQFCKHENGTIKEGLFTRIIKKNSFFADNWKNYAEVAE